MTRLEVKHIEYVWYKLVAYTHLGAYVCAQQVFNLSGSYCCVGDVKIVKYLHVHA